MSRRRSETRTYIKLDDGYDENPKIAGLSDAAFRAHVSMLCYCGRNLTDGKIPREIARRMATPKVLRELVAAGLLIEVPGPNPGELSGYDVHDYTKHQRTAEQVEQLRADRREAGSRGGKAKASRVATGVASATPDGKQEVQQEGQQTGGNPLPEDRDREQKEPPPYPPPAGGDRPTLSVVPPEPETAKPAKPSRRQAQRPLPDDFTITDAMKAWARERHLVEADVARQTERFKSWALSKDSRFSDWTQAWRNWIDKAVDRGDVRKRSPAKSTGGGARPWEIR